MRLSCDLSAFTTSGRASDDLSLCYRRISGTRSYVDDAMLIQSLRLIRLRSFGGNLAKCFYSLPVVSAAINRACDVIPNDLASATGYPAGLKLTAD